MSDIDGMAEVLVSAARGDRGNLRHYAQALYDAGYGKRPADADWAVLDAAERKRDAHLTAGICRDNAECHLCAAVRARREAQP